MQDKTQNGNHYRIRHLTTDDVEQYNDLLRYAFQVTEQELFTSFAQAMRPDQPLTEAEQDCVRTLWDELEKGGSLL